MIWIWLHLFICLLQRVTLLYFCNFIIFSNWNFYLFIYMIIIVREIWIRRLRKCCIILKLRVSLFLVPVSQIPINLKLSLEKLSWLWSKLEPKIYYDILKDVKISILNHPNQTKNWFECDLMWSNQINQKLSKINISN